MSRHETDALLDKSPKAPTKARRALAVKVVVALCGAAALATVALPRASSGGLRASPAALKASALKSGLVQEVDANAWVHQCLQYFDKYGDSFSDYDLISMPAGLCGYVASGAFENCELPSEWPENLYENTDLAKIARDNGTPLNLPDQLAFPKSVKDIVDIVEFAKTARMPISVKTSGHSYTGSNMLAGSVNVNLRDFPKYSQKSLLHSVLMHELPAVTACDADGMASVGLELPSACALALARGKPAVLRIGGGELWDDAVRAVDDANYWLEKGRLEKVEVMSGGAGTVSAAGGWMQGGGLSDGSERVFGFGADNVLELEMVLASGQHVKFGPSNWENDPELLYPRTTEVQGFCNGNVAAPDAEWQWEACTVEVPWEDLWYAVRGGGGGSYGIVTALTYQLHAKRTPERLKLFVKESYTDVCPRKAFDYLNASAIADQPAGCREVQDAFADFWIDLFYAPDNIGVSRETSLNCGDFGFFFNIYESNEMWCHDGGGAEVIQAWKSYWEAYNGPKPVNMAGKWDEWVNGLGMWVFSLSRSEGSVETCTPDTCMADIWFADKTSVAYKLALPVQSCVELFSELRYAIERTQSRGTSLR